MPNGKLYIAGPMSGYPEHNFPAFFDAEAKLNGRGWGTVNPAAYEKDIPEGSPRAVYLKKDLPLLAECDGIVLLPGWEESEGATFEFLTAFHLGLEIYRYSPMSEFGVMYLMKRKKWTVTPG